MRNDAGITISQTTHGKLPRLPFSDIATTVLGPRYNLSLVFVGNTLSRRLNREHRGKDKPANVLSFPLEKNTGEIFIDLTRARIEAPRFDMSYETFVVFLFIHGLFHLKGLDHGDTMDRLEQKTLKQFGFTGNRNQRPA